MGLRAYVTCELSTLGILTGLFLFFFPHRPLLVEVGLALFALVLLALNTGFTRNEIWRQFPVSGTKEARLRACLLRVSLVTLGIVMVFLGIRGSMGYGEHDWHSSLEHMANGHLLVAILVYFPWALVQQVLVQFYLLGRLRTLGPSRIAVVATGLSFALVHLPDVGVMAGTAAAGIWWAILYLQYRVLLPLALSHAVLGATFYYWVYGRDLMAEFSSLF